MHHRPHLVTTVIAFYLLTKLHCEGACRIGWFGRSCIFKCHCNKSATCSADGSCPANDKCADEYFGPGCQYNDLVHFSEVKSYVSDHDDSTCNPSSTATLIEIWWKIDFVFQWLRVVFETPQSIKPFTVILNNADDCKQRIYPFDDKTVDVECRYFGRIHRLKLIGPAAGSVCSIYVTAGRNVALNQQTSKSSDYPGLHPEQSKSSNAVDGNTDSELSKSSCAVTSVQRVQWVTVQLDRPFVLQTLSLYDTSNFMLYLSDFNVSTFYNNHLVNLCRDTRKKGKPVYILPMDSMLPSNVINISTIKHRPIAVCEVQAYAEVVCPDGKYGFECEKDCTCNVNQSCFIATGACSDRCPFIKFGFKCLQTCDKACVDQVCLERTGKCFRCYSGYQGDYCKEVCLPGSYGELCLSRCSNLCKDTCDHETGKCSCVDHAIGALCTECEDGWFGDKCNRTCPRVCPNNMCDQMSGQCVTCIGRRKPPKCEDCQEGWFGLNCNRTCPSLCGNHKCDQTLGNCMSCIGHRTGPSCEVCQQGWFGERCSQPCPTFCTNNLCNKISGKCVSCVGHWTGPMCDVCQQGWFGSHCAQTCPALCTNHLCNKITGKCVSCVGRHTGPYCDVCQHGWFGTKCASPCPRLCNNNMCNNITGHCVSCVEHRRGPQCVECQHGWFGRNCQLTCPRICPKNCNLNTGKCESCVGKRIGTKCEDCPIHYYGALCDIRCSVYCKNRTCDKVDGMCLACIDGYKGEYCNLEIEDVLPPVWMFPLIFPFPLLIVCCMLAGGGTIEMEE